MVIINKEEANEMPGEDRTGPTGMGPMTGRRMGICAGYPEQGFRFNRPMYGRGRGMRSGRGFGEYLGYPPQSVTQQDEVAYLENQAKEIKDDLSWIKTRLAELKMSKDQSGEK